MAPRQQQREEEEEEEETHVIFFSLKVNSISMPEGRGEGGRLLLLRGRIAPTDKATGREEEEERERAKRGGQKRQGGINLRVKAKKRKNVPRRCCC